MLVQLFSWTAESGWNETPSPDSVTNPQLVLYFAAPGALADGEAYSKLRTRYPEAHLMGCTTGGEILADEILDESIVATAVQFEKTRIGLSIVSAESSGDSFAAGQTIGRELEAPDLSGIFVLSDGINVNGSELVHGISDVIGNDLPLTGGMAGDGARFEVTRVGADSDPVEGCIAALGFYGNDLRIGHGSIGGWDDFGPKRVITRSEGNVLYELDGQPALDLYKRYLGEEAEGLPGSALLFPLKVFASNDPDSSLVRTIVGIDETDRSMIFAGNVPEGYDAQLMRGNLEHLIEGAAEAARRAAAGLEDSCELAILVSCIGRKLLFGQRIGEEVEAVSEVLGDRVPQIGFYSYGEISPHSTTGMCELHNQTMTITVFSEA